MKSLLAGDVSIEMENRMELSGGLDLLLTKFGTVARLGSCYW